MIISIVDDDYHGWWLVTNGIIFMVMDGTGKKYDIINLTDYFNGKMIWNYLKSCIVH